jgi:hypothetical protein
MHPIIKYRPLSVIRSKIRNYFSAQIIKKDLYENQNCIISCKCKYFQNSSQENEESTANAMRPIKPKSKRETVQFFVDLKQVNAIYFSIPYILGNF